jgi:hypothetical protein
MHLRILRGVHPAQTQRLNVHRPERNERITARGGRRGSFTIACLFSMRGRFGNAVSNTLGQSFIVARLSRLRRSIAGERRHIERAPPFAPTNRSFVLCSQTTSAVFKNFCRLATTIAHAIGEGNGRATQEDGNHAKAGRLLGEGVEKRSKRKGRGTCARLRVCLHIGFGGTRSKSPRAAPLIGTLIVSTFLRATCATVRLNRMECRQV